MDTDEYCIRCWEGFIQGYYDMLVPHLGVVQYIRKVFWHRHDEL